MSRPRQRGLRMLAFAVLVTCGLCGRHDDYDTMWRPPLTGQIHESLVLPGSDDRYFLVSLSVPADFEMHALARLGGEVWWWRDHRHPKISLDINPSKPGEHELDHHCARSWDLEVPLIDGLQRGCVDSTYRVERMVRFGPDVLRCSIESNGKDPERFGDAWEICANMTVVRETATLEPAERQSFSFVDRGSTYDVTIKIPRHYESSSTSDPARQRLFMRGFAAPQIRIGLNEHLPGQRQHPAFMRTSWPDDLCWGTKPVWQRQMNDGSMSYCRSTELNDVFLGVVRLVKNGADLVSCEIHSNGDDRIDPDALARVCESMTVTKRQITW